uniref:Uncharacterized protein n=1 Tax=Heterorhabditis bacteriophora TaxID=37862 RepID=A0A1I7XNY0_HETBA
MPAGCLRGSAQPAASFAPYIYAAELAEPLSDRLLPFDSYFCGHSTYHLFILRSYQFTMNSLELDDDAFYICTEMSPRCFVVQKASRHECREVESQQ